jgi:hypothetical protein
MPFFCACGGPFNRIHRSFREKLVYMALYRCKECQAVKPRPRRFMFYFQTERGCPLCGTQKLNRLASPDHIDRMHWNLYKPLRGLMDLQLYHCRYCRIQFYDRRHEAKPSGNGA